MKFSYVIPCYKSKNTIRDVVLDIIDTMNSIDEKSYEIICVNDYPHDDTYNLLQDLSKEYTCVKALNLSRNFRQHSALIYGDL